MEKKFLFYFYNHSCCDDRENIPQHILIALDYIAENGIE